MVGDRSMSEMNNSLSPFYNRYSTKPNKKYLTEDDNILFTLEPGEERKQSDHVGYFLSFI